MEYIVSSFCKAVELILSFDEEVVEISFISIKVSCAAITISTILGVPMGFIIAYSEFSGKRLLILFLNTMMALPTVAVGLVVYGFLTRESLFGNFELLYTPWAMIIGQVVLALPIITGLSVSAIQNLDKRVSKEALALGATIPQTVMTVLSEGRLPLCGAVAAGFGRIFTEVGVSMIVGGNIAGYTRNIPTAIAFEVQRGEFALGMALGFILIFIAFFFNIIFYIFYARMK
jgi:tungstate transport system permease protein